MEDQTKEISPAGGSMPNPEKPIEGVLPAEQREIAKAAEKAAENLQKEGYRPEDVARAVEQAQQTTPARDEGVEAVRKFGEVTEQPEPQDFIPESAKIQSEIKGQIGGGLGSEEADMLGIGQELGISVPLAEELSPMEERLKRERESYLRYHEGALIPEAFRTSYDPLLIRGALREYMAQNEELLQMPDIHRGMLAYHQLKDRARTFELALSPDESWRNFFEEKGLLGKKELAIHRAQKFHQIIRDRFEIDTTTEGIKVIEEIMGKEIPKSSVEELQDGKARVVVREEVINALLDNRKGRDVLYEEKGFTFTPVVSEGRLPELVKTCEEGAEEAWARERIFIAEVLYEQSSGVLDILAKQFIDNRYARITTADWKTLVSLKETPGETISYGDKIDMAKRLYALLGTGGGSGDRGGGREYAIKREENIRKALQHQPDEFKKALGILGEDPQKSKQEEEKFINEIVELAGKNTFCNTPRVDRDVDQVRKWVRDKINGNNEDRNTDTKSSETNAWRLFFLWGLATKFDNRRLDTDPKTMSKFHAPNGWPSSDDGMKLRYPESYRLREGVQNFTHGPDATLNKYGDGVYGQPNWREWPLAVSFLEFAIPRDRKEMVKDETTREYELGFETEKIDKVGQMRSLWEEWWGDPEHSDAGSRTGKLLRDLSWDGLRKYEWWRYNLSFFFGGRQGNGLFDLINQESWERPKLINKGSLREIVKACDYTVGGFTVTGGEIQKWLRELNADSRRGSAARQKIQRLTNEGKIAKVSGKVKTVEELSSSDFEKVFIDPIKQRIRELILEGAIASEYERLGMLAGQLEWGDIIGPNPLGSPITAFRQQLPGIGGRGVPGRSVSGEQLSNTRGQINWQLQQAGFNVDFGKVVEETRNYLYNVKIPN